MNSNTVRTMVNLTILAYIGLFTGDYTEAFLCAFMCFVMKKQVDYVRAARARLHKAYICKEDIVPVEDCAWRRILRGQKDASFLAWLGLTASNFFALARVARDYYPQSDRGRPSILNCIDVVGITLRWLHGISDIVGIHTAFGISKPTAYRYLDVGVRCLLEALRHHPYAVVAWPAAEQIAHYALQILNKGARAGFRKNKWPRGLRCIPFAWIDGSIFLIPKPYHFFKQSRYYSGKHKAHCINCIFVFAPDGSILYYKINAPGSYHDLKVAESFIYNFLQDPEVTPRGYGVFGDVGFRKIQLEKNILTILKKNDKFWKKTGARAASQRRTEKMTEKWIFTHRMAIEWAFAGLKSTFRRLSTTLSNKSVKRAELLELCVLLHNFRLRSSPEYCNQIRTVYEMNKSEEERANF